MDLPEDPEDLAEVPQEQRAAVVIEAVRAFAAGLPITVEMSPYRNRYSRDVQGVVLTDLFADEPGKGTGSAVVREMIRLAVAADISLYTDAQGPESASFYEKMGFERSAGSGHQFAHHPPLPAYLLEDDDMPAPSPGMR
jgi:GNAT superfamily N-acetyltransferase